MKKLFIYALAALMTGGFVASCSDDDPEIQVPEKPEPKPEPEPEPEKVVCPIQKTTFTGVEGLKLTYSGEPLLGKQVLFTPDEKEATKATLVLSGIVPASKALGFPSCGVIPGEAATTLNLELKIDGETVSFEGKEEKAGRTIAYKGSASKTVLNLDLTVTMEDNALSNKKFAPVPFIPANPKESIVGQSPITMTWKSTGTVPLFEEKNYDFNNFFILAQSLPLIPVNDKDKVLIAQALNMVLKEIAFLPDGNIQAEYKDSLTDTTWKKSPLHMATYKVEGADKVRVFINVDQIMAFVQNQGSRAGINDLLGVLIAKASELLVQGVVVTYGEVDGQMQFYLDKDTMLPIVNILIPFFKDQAFVTELVDMLAQLIGPDMGPLVKMVATPILLAMPGVIEGTTEMHFGLNMTAAK